MKGRNVYNKELQYWVYETSHKSNLNKMSVHYYKLGPFNCDICKEPIVGYGSMRINWGYRLIRDGEKRTKTLGLESIEHFHVYCVPRECKTEKTETFNRLLIVEKVEDIPKEAIIYLPQLPDETSFVSKDGGAMSVFEAAMMVDKDDPEIIDHTKYSFIDTEEDIKARIEQIEQQRLELKHRIYEERKDAIEKVGVILNTRPAEKDDVIEGGEYKGKEVNTGQFPWDHIPKKMMSWNEEGLKNLKTRTLDDRPKLADLAKKRQQELKRIEN